MSGIDLPRVAPAARQFLDQLARHAAHCRDPGYDIARGGVLVYLAAQTPNLALQEAFRLSAGDFLRL